MEPTKLALKRLAASDLSFFETFFRSKRFSKTNLKGINLNEDVFFQMFYPLLERPPSSELRVVTTIYGPGLAEGWRPPGDSRPITYNNAKNWRLNGGTIPDDPRRPGRFDDLQPNDLALLRFRGEGVPTELDVLLVSVAEPDDIEAFAALDPLVGRGGRKTMATLTTEQLREALAFAVLEPGHPLAEAIAESDDDPAVEDLALGGSIVSLRRRSGGRLLTPGELLEAKQRAEAIGADGEGLLNAWLLSEQTAGRISRLKWVSQSYAAAPYDFAFNSEDDNIFMDAKSTNGAFERDIHLSLGEMVHAATCEGRYDIARLYLVSQEGAKFRLARDIKRFAQAVVSELRLPRGVSIDGFKVQIASLEWGPEMNIGRPATAED